LVSTAGSIQQIREAKSIGLQVTCDVAAYQVAFTDEEITAFDTNYKVDPPFRSAADKAAIIKGLQDGTIDVLVSNHKPQDTESKKLEFDLAEFGIINLETAFAVANTYLAADLALDQIIEKFTSAPRKILGLPDNTIEEGTEVNLTFFAPAKEWIPRTDFSLSRSANTPFFGQKLRGQVYGIYYKNQFTQNLEF
jgi:dihydroorotase